MESITRKNDMTQRALAVRARVTSKMEGHVIELDCIYTPVSAGEITENNKNLYKEMLN